MLSVLLYLLLLVIVAGLIFYLIGMLPLPEPWKTAVRVILILVFIVLLISLLRDGWGGFVVVREPVRVVR